DMDLLTIFEVQKSLTPPPPAEFKAEYSVSFDLAEAPDYVSIFKPVPTSTTQKELDDAKAELHSLLLKMPPGPPAWTIESNAATALKAKIKALEGKIQHEKMVHATPLIIKEPTQVKFIPFPNLDETFAELSKHKFDDLMPGVTWDSLHTFKAPPDPAVISSHELILRNDIRTILREFWIGME